MHIGVRTIKREKIIVAGLMVMDILVKPVDISLFENDTNYPDSIDFLTGGDALNVAINLGKLGAKVSVSGLVGRDSGGDLILRDFDKNGVDRKLVEIRDDVQTTVSIVMSCKNGERHFICRPDSTLRYDASVLTEEVLSDAKLLYIGSTMALPALEGPALRDLLRRARSLGVLTAMDATQPPDDHWLERIDCALPYVDLFIPSYGEAVHLTGQSDPASAARFLRERGVNLAGVKLGENGCYIDDGQAPFFLPAIRLENPVDLTGAGDAFMSGFLYGYTQGFTARECAKFATAMSYNCIQSLGASTHALTRDSIQDIVRKYEND